MPRVQRVSDVIETHAERAVYYGGAGLFAAAIAGVLLYYHGSSNMFVPLGSILALGGVGGVGFAGFLAFKGRKVQGLSVVCPICEGKNDLTHEPDDDFPCVKCHRMIPIRDGKPLSVSQVRCGYCNELNYYSDKTEALLCEKCNHEIPISRDDYGAPKKVIPMGYAVVDDEALYELVLTGAGNREEELIQALQTMLALNRNQVKQMLTELPVTLLTGITRKKAEMLRAQLSIHDGMAEFRQMDEARY